MPWRFLAGGRVPALRFRVLLLLLAAVIPLAAAGVAVAQPQVPSTFYGSAAIDGKPVPDGTEIRGLIDGNDCTQLGATYRGTVTDGGVSAYLINVVHESQKPGCGKAGKTVVFTIGGRQAAQTALWKQGPQQVNLNAGQGQPPELPTPTPTRPLAPSEAAATATEQAKFTPRPAGTLPTDEVPIVVNTHPAGGAVPPAAPPPADGGFPVFYALLIAVGAIVLTGLAVGAALGRRSGPPRPPPGDGRQHGDGP